MLMTLIRINVINQNTNDSDYKNKVVPHNDYVNGKEIYSHYSMMTR